MIAQLSLRAVTSVSTATATATRGRTRGEYVLSDDAGFDPNVGSTVEFRRLRPR